MEKQEKKERKILTDNRLATVNKRETSFEGLAMQFENGEDGIYNLISDDKNVIFTPKVTITQKDLNDIPELRQLRESIERWENYAKTATGRAAFIIKKTLIEMRKDQYIIKQAYKPPITLSKLTRNYGAISNYPSAEWINLQTQEVQYYGVSLLDPQIITLILCNYSRLRQECWDLFQGDTWYLMSDFDKISALALEDFPLYQRIVEYKIDGLTNTEIKANLEQEFGFTHSLEYISSLWRNKIPKLIATTAAEEWITWYYTNQEYGQWKRCSCCGQIKLAHSYFFSKNNSSRDGWYSICKKCRKQKNKKAKEKKSNG